MKEINWKHNRRHIFGRLFLFRKLISRTTTTTTTKPFVPSIWGRLHEPKEKYAGSGI